jgi:hypothetical protein
MKQLIITLSLMSSMANAYVLDCRVAKVYDDNVFEEGLSTDEYPDVDLGYEGRNLILSIGSMQNYETKAGDTVEYQTSGDQLRVFAKYRDSNGYVIIEVSDRGPNKNARWANLKVKEPDSKLQTVALLVCKK